MKIETVLLFSSVMPRVSKHSCKLEVFHFPNVNIFPYIILLGFHNCRGVVVGNEVCACVFTLFLCRLHFYKNR